MIIIVCGNLQAQSQGCRDCGDCQSFDTYNSY